ncbi:hypothetical protein GXW82_10800 [Streptacidiphilus sp. 4-A2]|nr:hypothetical protein [Streptacidiphilus sp. 4-A2]
MLAGLLQKPDQIREVSSWLYPEVFDEGPRREVCEVILAVEERGEPVDQLTVEWEIYQQDAQTCSENARPSSACTPGAGSRTPRLSSGAPRSGTPSRRLWIGCRFRGRKECTPWRNFLNCAWGRSSGMTRSRR